MKTLALRCLLLTHRYLGIALGWLMLIWCLSGFVMMYVPYPQLDDELRVASLESIDTQSCCVLDPATFDPVERVASFEVEMLDGKPALRVKRDFGAQRQLDLRDGSTLAESDEASAVRTGRRFAAAQGMPVGAIHANLIEHDQWTVYGFDEDAPLYRIALDDRTGAEIYVSSVSGKLVQLTTRRQRFWNWLGAVPHWLYPTVLRQNAWLWTQVVVWSSLLGGVLAVLGLGLGVWQLRRTSEGRIVSPYRGFKWWHHVPGLLFGFFALAWVSSGFISMNPWGLFETQGAGEEPRLRGELPDWNAVREMLQALPQAKLPPNIVHIESAFFGGQLYAVATMRDGERRRFDQQWKPTPLDSAEIDAAARALAASQPSSWRWLTSEDKYYYSHGADKASLPVIRVIVNGAEPMSYYLDPISGSLRKKVDQAARGYRWWHYGLHRWDFFPALRARPLWDVLMWCFLTGASMVTATGAWLGVKRLFGRA